MNPTPGSSMSSRMMLLAIALLGVGCACGGSSCGGAKTGSGPPVGVLALRGTLTPAASGGGASVALSGSATQSTVADAAGAFAFTGLSNGSYTVTPAKVGVAFTPSNQAVTVNGSDVSGIDFAAASFTANLTVDGAQRFQTMDGMGVNINVNSWNNGQLAPALDMLIQTPPALGNGASLLRVIRDPMDWVPNEADIALLHSLDQATLARIYETAPMRDIWSTIGYLNSKGFKGNKIMLNFMGWTPTWLGGSGAYGSPSHITAGKEPAFATMVASLVYYGRIKKGLDFTLLAPLNESDWNCLEGPCVASDQYSTVLTDLIDELNAMGLTDIRLVGPDTASPSAADAYIAGMMGDAKIATRADHFGIHIYGGATQPRIAYSGHDYWLTETGASCSNCDDAGTPAQGEWAFANETGDAILSDLENGLAAVCVYDGYDSYYFHHNSFGYWGLLAYDQGTGFYTKRKRFYVNAQLNGFVSPGCVRISESDAIPSLGAVVAFLNVASGRVSMIGHNSGSTPITIKGQLDNCPAIASFHLYLTDSGSRNLLQGADVPVAGGGFVVTIPADTFFSLTN